jgi:hypothetical protein
MPYRWYRIDLFLKLNVLPVGRASIPVPKEQSSLKEKRPSNIEEMENFLYIPTGKSCSGEYIYSPRKSSLSKKA